jgi:hypothetical protein
MPDSKLELEHILKALMTQIVFARAHLKIARVLGDADPVVIATAPTFFGLTRDAHLQAAQMYTAKLHDKNRDSVTLRTALQTAERVAGTFEYASASEVRASIASLESQITHLETTLMAIQKRRNEYLAYVAERTIIDPASLNAEAPLTLDDLDHVLVETGDMINEISQLFRGCPVPVVATESALLGDWSVR